DRDAALPFQRERIGLGAAVIDAADLVDDPGGMQQPLGQAGLTGVYMRQNPQVERFHEASCPYALALIPFRVDMNAARMLLSIGSPTLPGQYSMRRFARAKHFHAQRRPWCRSPDVAAVLQIEGRGHGREGGRLPERRQAEQLLGGAEQGV